MSIKSVHFAHIVKAHTMIRGGSMSKQNPDDSRFVNIILTIILKKYKKKSNVAPQSGMIVTPPKPNKVLGILAAIPIVIILIFFAVFIEFVIQYSIYL